MQIRLGDLECAVKDGQWITDRIGYSNARDVKQWLMNLPDDQFAEFTLRVVRMAQGCALVKGTLDRTMVGVEK